MLHTQRVWCVTTFDNVEEIAHGLTGNTQVLCTGIRYRKLLLLNDAISEDGNQEYAVIDEDSGHQLESLTCSWMRPERLQAALLALADNRDHVVMVRTWTDQKDPRERIETQQEHERCALCR